MAGKEEQAVQRQSTYKEGQTQNTTVSSLAQKPLKKGQLESQMKAVDKYISRMKKAQAQKTYLD